MKFEDRLDIYLGSITEEIIPQDIIECICKLPEQSVLEEGRISDAAARLFKAYGKRMGLDELVQRTKQEYKGNIGERLAQAIEELAAKAEGKKTEKAPQAKAAEPPPVPEKAAAEPPPVPEKAAAEPQEAAPEKAAAKAEQPGPLVKEFDRADAKAKMGQEITNTIRSITDTWQKTWPEDTKMGPKIEKALAWVSKTWEDRPILVLRAIYHDLLPSLKSKIDTATTGVRTLSAAHGKLEQILSTAYKNKATPKSSE